MDSIYELIYFFVWPLPETAMGALCNCLVGALPYTHYVTRSGTRGGGSYWVHLTSIDARSRLTLGATQHGEREVQGCVPLCTDVGILNAGHKQVKIGQASQRVIVTHPWERGGSGETKRTPPSLPTPSPPPLRATFILEYTYGYILYSQ